MLNGLTTRGWRHEVRLESERRRREDQL